jgi:hypothetical protein
VRIHAGQGDVLMTVHGLQALRELGAEVLHPEAVVYTRTDTASLVATLLPGVRVESLQASAHAEHPRYVVVQHTSWSTVVRNLFYPDFYVNFPERRLVTSFGYPPPSAVHRLRMWLTDITLGTPTNRARETPDYYALKIWAPLGARWGISNTDLMRGLYTGYRTLRERLEQQAARLENSGTPLAVPEVAIFPAGRGFQYVPPDFVGRLVQEAGLTAARYACWFGPKDPTIADYERAGLRCLVSDSPETALRVVQRAAATLTSDSFVSHLAQLAARKHIALMSHDLPTHTMHPAAASDVIFEPQDCCPCFYTIRDPGTVCRAGHTQCGVFGMDRYLRRAVAALARALR